MDFNANTKKRIVEESSTIQQIFQNEQSKMIKKLQDMKVVAEAVPQFYNIQAGLYKHKAKTIPPVPKSDDDIELKDEWIMCEDGQRRFLVEQIQEKREMFLFCSDIGLTVLAGSKR